MRIRTTDVSGHVVLYRPAVSWLTWHLSITSAQFIDTQMNKVGHMSPHASIFLLTQCSILAFTSCSNFLFTPRPYNTSKPQTDPRKGKHIVREPRLRGIQKQTNKKNPLHRPCRLFLLYYVRSIFPSILFLPFLSFCGNALQVCCILTCKNRRIIDFLTSLEENQRI